MSMYTLQTGVGQIRAVACDPDDKDKLIISLSEANKKLTTQLNTCQSELFKCRQGASNVDAVTARENATQKEVAALKAEIVKLKGDAQAAAVEAVQQDKNLRTLHHNNTEAWKGDASTLRADIDKLTKANAEVQAKLNEALINKKNTSSLVHELAKLCDDFEHDAVQYTKNLAEYKEKEARAVEEIKEWSEKHVLASADISSKDEGIKRLEEHIESLEAKIAEYQEKEARAVQEIKEWSAKHHFASADILSKDEGIKRLKEDIESLEELVNALRDEKKALFDLHNKTKEELSQKTQRVEQLNGELKATTSGMSGDHKKQVEQLEQIIVQNNTKHQEEVEEVKAQAIREKHELQNQLHETKAFMEETKDMIQQRNNKHEEEVAQFEEVIAQEKQVNQVLERDISNIRDLTTRELEEHNTEVQRLETSNQKLQENKKELELLNQIEKDNLFRLTAKLQGTTRQMQENIAIHAQEIEQFKTLQKTLISADSQQVKELKKKITELENSNKHYLERFEIEQAINTGLRNAARLAKQQALKPIPHHHGIGIPSKLLKTPQLEGNYQEYAKQVEDSYANFIDRSSALRLDLRKLGLEDELTDKKVDDAVKEAVEAAQVDGANKRRQKEVRINVIRKLCWEFKKRCNETVLLTGTGANKGKQNVDHFLKKEAATRVAAFLKTKFLVPENEQKEEDKAVPLGRQEVDSEDDNRESDSPNSSGSSSSSDKNSRGAQLPNESNYYPYKFSKSPNRPNEAGEGQLPENVRDHLGFRPNPPKTVHVDHEGMAAFENEEAARRLAAMREQLLARSQEKKRAGAAIPRPNPPQLVNFNPYMLSPHVCFEA